MAEKAVEAAAPTTSDLSLAATLLDTTDPR